MELILIRLGISRSKISHTSFPPPAKSKSRTMNFGEFIDRRAQQPLPESLIDHESDLEEWGSYCKTLELKILKLFAIGLKVSVDMPANSFQTSHLSHHTNIHRSQLNKAAQLGSPLAISGTQVAPSGDSATTLPSPPTIFSQVISAAVHIPTTAPSPFFFNVPANLDWKFCLRVRR